jgi:hypothetical protein
VEPVETDFFEFKVDLAEDIAEVADAIV